MEVRLYADIRVATYGVPICTMIYPAERGVAAIEGTADCATEIAQPKLSVRYAHNSSASANYWKSQHLRSMVLFQDAERGLHVPTFRQLIEVGFLYRGSNDNNTASKE